MRCDIRFELKSPLVHGAFGPDTGNCTLFRRMTAIVDGRRMRIPAVSGNSLRGLLRREAMRHLFDGAGLNMGNCPNWDRLYAALANGGTLQGAGESTVRPEETRKLREALPPLSVFGAALYNRLLPGRLAVDILWPECDETIAMVESHLAEDLIEEVSQVRHVDRDEQDSGVSGVTPMPYTFETLVTGAVLIGGLSFGPSATAIEKGCVFYALGRIQTLGGKTSSGFGRVGLIEPTYDELDSWTAPYMEWCEGNLWGRDALLQLAESMAPAKKPARKKKVATKKE